MRLWPCSMLMLSSLVGCWGGEERTAVGLGSVEDSLFEAGLALYGDGQFDSAHAVWSTALARVRASGDQQSQARILTELGLAEWRLARITDSRKTQESALALKEKLKLAGELSRSYNALGLLANSEGRTREALEFFSRAVASARAASDTVAEVKALGNQAIPAANLGDFDLARTSSQGLRAAGAALGDARLEANGLANEAWVDLLVGDPQPAIARLDTARQLYVRIVYRVGEQVALGQLASAWELTGDYHKSFAALDTALSLARDLGLREDEAINLRLMADMHARVGDHRRALRFYDQAAAIFRETTAHSELGLALRGAAQVYLDLGNAARARESVANAAAMHRDAGEGHEELLDLLLQAGVALRTGAPNQAKSLLDSARSLAERLGTRGARIEVGLGEARLADQSGDSRLVLDLLQRVAPELAPGDFNAEGEMAALEARALARTGRAKAAVDAGRRAIAAIERIRSYLPSDALRSTLVADRFRTYGDLVLTLLSLGRSAEAFEVADQARSRALIDHLSAVRGDSSGTLPRRLVEGEDLLRRIDRLVQRLRAIEPNPPHQRGMLRDTRDAALSAELVALRNEYEALYVRAIRWDPRASILLGTSQPRIDQLQAALTPTQALVEYLLTDDRLVIFVVTHGKVHAEESALDGAALTSRIRLIRDLWGSSRSDWRVGLPASRTLHNTLLAPILNAGWLDGIHDLIIVPQGILGQVPFAALQSDRTGRFLIQDFTLIHVPSAGAVAATGGIGSGGNANIPPGSAFAPFPRELPASEGEAEAFTTHLAGSIALSGPAASESALRRALTQPGPVHVATHGILNSRNPMFSRIELARPAVVKPDDDGRLEVHEILGLRIASQLVFFSGCETGAGLEWTADPVLGTADLTLAQAVMAAGAQQVISTLWRIDDEGAAEFAQEFYGRLTSSPVAAAFADAHRALAASARFSSPYYWAGYILSGVDRPASPIAASMTLPLRGP